MKTERSYPNITVNQKAQSSLVSNHPWVYAGDIKATSGNIENGALTDVLSEKGRYLGTGFYSANSKIALRVISNNANDDFSDAFFTRRVSWALDYRETVMNGDTAACRLIFGEADRFPGLTVDRYNDILVTETLSYGMEKLKDRLFPIIISELSKRGETINGVYERNESPLRLSEGLEAYKGWYGDNHRDDNRLGDIHPQSTSTVITENGVKFTVDFENGQKTGFFLDQKYNRAAVSKYVRGKRVLDCFTHTGSFALNAAFGGAGAVTAVDISQAALDTAKENASLNGLTEKVTFVAADVFAYLDSLSNGAFDFIILDPPAFTKSRETVDSAERGYREINYRAMKLLPRGGYLATCSCSHFMDSERFAKMLRTAAFDAKVTLRQVEERRQSPDHPILWNVPESDYLKFYIFQIV